MAGNPEAEAQPPATHVSGEDGWPVAEEVAVPVKTEAATHVPGASSGAPEAPRDDSWPVAEGEVPEASSTPVAPVTAQTSDDWPEAEEVPEVPLRSSSATAREAWPVGPQASSTVSPREDANPNAAVGGRSAASSGGSWPEAVEEPETSTATWGERRTDLRQGEGSAWPRPAEPAGSSWPRATEPVDRPSRPAEESSAAPSSSWDGWLEAEQGPEDHSPGGLRGLIAQLTWQLEEEVKRREMEEAELETRAAEKQRLLQELENVRSKRRSMLADAEAAEHLATETEKQHNELAQSHRELRQEIGRQETELQKAREAARLRSGSGRDWAREGPEKDALVETKLKIAEAHDQLAQLKQQLRLNRDGLKKQLDELQIENCRLRGGRGRGGNTSSASD